MNVIYKDAFCICELVYIREGETDRGVKEKY